MIVIATLLSKVQTVRNLVRPFSKKHRFRTPFDSEPVKGTQTLVKFGREYFHLVFSSLWEDQVCDIRPLVTCWIFVLLGNILTAKGKYPLRYCQDLMIPVQMQLSWKVKTFSDFFVRFLETTLNFEHFEKKWWSSYLLYFRNYRLEKTWLDHSLKNTVSEDPLIVNIWKGPKLFKILIRALSLYFSSPWENLVWNIPPLVTC